MNKDKMYILKFQKINKNVAYHFQSFISSELCILFGKHILNTIYCIVLARFLNKFI